MTHLSYFFAAYGIIGLAVAAREVWQETRYRAMSLIEVIGAVLFVSALWPLAVAHYEIGPRRRL